MPIRPVVGYFEITSDRKRLNHYRDALEYWLRTRFGFEVVYCEQMSELLYRSPALVLIEVLGNPLQAKDYIKELRKNFSSVLPIVLIISGNDPIEKFQPRKNLYVCEYAADEIIFELVSGLVMDLRALPNWFGVYTPEEQAQLMDQLENAYRVHYPDNDERMFGTPDRNHRIVSEAIRLRLLPSECRKEEFDETLFLEMQHFEPTEPLIYAKETERIRTMSDEERRQLWDIMLREEGYERDGTILIKKPGGCSTKVNGFAIDALTLEMLITYQKGEHLRAKDILKQRLEWIQNKGEAYRWVVKFDQVPLNNRIIKGLIFKIEGFGIPILVISGSEIGNRFLPLVVEYLKNRRMFIPITPEGFVIES
jgi:hypothetical protein